MFDIGFFELVVVAIVALVVLGPERLPHAVRMTGAFVGKARRLMMNVRDEFEREVQLSEMQQRIKEQLEKAGLDEARKTLEETKKAIEEANTILARDVADKLTSDDAKTPPAETPPDPAPADTPPAVMAAPPASDTDDTQREPGNRS